MYQKSQMNHLTIKIVIVFLCIYSQSYSQDFEYEQISQIAYEKAINSKYIEDYVFLDPKIEKEMNLLLYNGFNNDSVIISIDDKNLFRGVLTTEKNSSFA